jgi:hypothetical protein
MLYPSVGLPPNKSPSGGQDNFRGYSNCSPRLGVEQPPDTIPLLPRSMVFDRHDRVPWDRSRARAATEKSSHALAVPPRAVVCYVDYRMP